MRLLHYSAEPVSALRSVEQTDEYGMKPFGFWISVEGDDDWESWCRSEKFGLERLAAVHEVTLKTDANILYASNPDTILQISCEYGQSLTRTERYRHRLDWARLASRYQGLIIAPYQWACRNEAECFWYYSWDCASGCIWDADAIESVSLIKHNAIEEDGANIAKSDDEEPDEVMVLAPEVPVITSDMVGEL